MPFNNPWDDKNKKIHQSKKAPDIEELMNLGQDWLRKFTGGSGANHTPQHYWLAGLLVLGLWLSTGVYTIQPEEEGVIMRFGKYVRSATPGLNYKFPTPIEILTKVPVTRTNKEEIGYRSSGAALTVEALRQNSIADESQMLTTDENIVDINFDVQWNVANAKDFILNVRDVGRENTVKSVAESAMREVIGLSRINDVLAEERSKIEQNARQHMQDTLDNLHMGVNIISVQLRRVDPPKEAIDAYRDVQNAKQDKEREINQATSYRNDVVPKARGEAERMLQEAEAYKQRVIADAVGEANRFNAVLAEYQRAKEVTRKKMYIETMQEIFSNTEKIILDKSAGNVLPHLPLSNKSENK